jgi:hypothetical protein
MDEHGYIEVPYVDVNIVNGVMSQIRKSILAHEIPILMTTFGEDNISTFGATGDTKWLQPEEEYGRLLKRYGNNGKGAEVVQEVFGRQMEGRLRGLMERSMDMFPLPDEEELTAKEAAEAKPEPPKGRRRLRSKATD